MRDSFPEVATRDNSDKTIEERRERERKRGETKSPGSRGEWRASDQGGEIQCAIRLAVAYFSQVDFASARVKDGEGKKGDFTCEIWHRGRGE